MEYCIVTFARSAVDGLISTTQSDTMRTWMVGTEVDDPLLLVVFPEPLVCRLVEALWMLDRGETSGFRVLWHGSPGLSHRRHDGSTAGGLGVYPIGDVYIPKPTIARRLVSFYNRIPVIIASARSGWTQELVDEAAHWALYVPPGTPKTSVETAVFPARVGRCVVAKYAATHTLFVKKTRPGNQDDVFWRLYLQLSSHSFPDLLEPGTMFGRVQCDVYYALVRRDLIDMFVNATWIRPVIRRENVAQQQPNDFMLVRARKNGPPPLVQ